MTNNDGLARKARLLRNHGEIEKYHHTILGYNYRMTELSAAIGLVQLKKLDELNEKRIRNAEMLSEGIKKIQMDHDVGIIGHVSSMSIGGEGGIARGEEEEESEPLPKE